MLLSVKGLKTYGPMVQTLGLSSTQIPPNPKTPQKNDISPGNPHMNGFRV